MKHAEQQSVKTDFCNEPSQRSLDVFLGNDQRTGRWPIVVEGKYAGSLDVSKRNDSNDETVHWDRRSREEGVQ